MFSIISSTTNNAADRVVKTLCNRFAVDASKFHGADLDTSEDDDDDDEVESTVWH